MPLTLAELTGIAAHLKTAFGPTTTHVLIATRSPIGHELGDEESYLGADCVLTATKLCQHSGLRRFTPPWAARGGALERKKKRLFLFSTQGARALKSGRREGTYREINTARPRRKAPEAPFDSQDRHEHDMTKSDSP